MEAEVEADGSSKKLSLLQVFNSNIPGSAGEKQQESIADSRNTDNYC